MLVAHRIVRDIVRGGLRPGDLLPPERAMLQTYGTGRGTLREALRLLEFQGVIALKPGPGGGPILMNPEPAHLASTLQLLMQLNKASYRVIVEARTALEPMISQLAAERISAESLAELAGTIGRMRAGPAGVLAVRGHRHLAERGPVVLRDGDVDDPGRLGEVPGEPLLCRLEVPGLDVRGTRVPVAEGLDQHVLRGIVHAPGPVEPQAAGLGAAGLGELPGDLGPGVGVLGQDPELGGDEDHGSPCPVTGAPSCRSAPTRC
jgi:DNA-binding transcriptional regulator YhcF (GntR family)